MRSDFSLNNKLYLILIISYYTKPAQLVTSKPSDVRDVSLNLDAVTRTGVFSHVRPKHSQVFGVRFEHLDRSKSEGSSGSLRS